MNPSPFFSIINLTKQRVLAEKAVLADTLFLRLKGLLGRQGLGVQEALVLSPCDSVHTFFMRFAIDVVFLDKQNKIIGIYPCLKPWRITRIFFGATTCLELPAGALSATQTQLGDDIKIIK
jgi:uncharacterized membrane protein (UPF0127 family)